MLLFIMVTTQDKADVERLQQINRFKNNKGGE